MAEYCKGIIYASKVRQNSLSELSIGDFKIDCFINWVCVLFQLFYSVTVDSFWQFRINSFLGCALVPRRREEAPISSVHLTRLATPRWSVQSVYSQCTVCTVRANATWHPACLTKKQLSLTDIYCQSPAQPGPGTRDGHQSEAEAHTNSLHPQQIRSDTAWQYRIYSLALWRYSVTSSFSLIISSSSHLIVAFT